MWLKILKYIVIAAEATGLDEKIKTKIKDWIGRRLDGIENRIEEVDKEIRDAS